MRRLKPAVTACGLKLPFMTPDQKLDRTQDEIESDKPNLTDQDPSRCDTLQGYLSPREYQDHRR
jgi:predicted small lipoprotein YifL